jgi:hypothetical protein
MGTVAPEDIRALSESGGEPMSKNLHWKRVFKMFEIVICVKYLQCLVPIGTLVLCALVTKTRHGSVAHRAYIKTHTDA